MRGYFSIFALLLLLMPRRERNPFVKRNETIDIQIEDYAFGGKGIGRIRNEHGEFVVFVPNTIPGQLVKARIVKSRKKFAEAKLVEVVQPSENETEIPFQEIPGAPYIKLPIELQHAYKKESTFSLLSKIGKVENIESKFDEFISSPNIFHYRNKMEYGFSAIGYDHDQKTDVDEFTLGFKKRGVWWLGDNLNKDSGLFDKELEDVLMDIRNYCKDSGFAPWHGPKREGFFRYFVVRKSFINNELLFNIVTTSIHAKEFDFTAFGEFLKDLFGERFAGLLHTINDETGDRTIATTGSVQLVLGKEKIVEELLGLQFEISMQSFFQTNPKSAEKLYSKVIDYVFEDERIAEDAVVLDLFCGTGTIGQLVASNLPDTKVIGVDIVASAIKDAKKNAERNQIGNVEFYADDVGKFLYHQPQFQNQIRTLILDPARAGIAPKTLKKIINLDAKRLVYVSCNPATQARDTETLQNSGYHLKKFSLVDQFPHTAHIETIALFEKRES
tara:strand:- start:148091 stop:149593 length:1503 start_codon:yes stop_codon:yes gene_type:complete